MKRRPWERFEGPRVCNVAAAIVGSAVVGGAISADASRSAAHTQADAANRAAAQQQASGQTAYNNAMGAIPQVNALYQPYQALGASSAQQLQSQMPSLTAGFNPTMQQLQSMPGYQFELQQGLEAAQNGFAARGLGSSGAAMKGAANYAQGLAAQNWMNDANMFWTNQNNAYNKLMGGVNTGANAADAMAKNQINLTGYAGNALTGQSNAAAQSQMFGAQAQAAGQIGQANAWTNALNTGVNGAVGYNMYNNWLNKQPNPNQTSPSGAKQG